MAKRDSIMTKPKDSKGAFMRLLSYLGAFKALILLVAVLCLISNVLSLWGPTLAGSAINEAAAGQGRTSATGGVRNHHRKAGIAGAGPDGGLAHP